MKAIVCTLILLGAGAEARAASDSQIEMALRRAKITPADPKMAEVHRLCDLRVGGRDYPALDVVERLKEVREDRLLHHVVVINDRLRKVGEVPYDPPAKALPCQDDVLSFSDPVMIDGTLPEGRRVRVSVGGTKFSVIPDGQ